MKRVHVVGIGPRCGTTLMMELLAHCYDFDAYARHEMSVLEVPSVPVEKFCSKRPSELKVAARMLAANSDLWVVCMLRDPRDVIVSRHRKDPDAYWSNLSIWLKNFNYYNENEHLSRVVVVRYEDLVADPDRVQHDLEAQIPFLNRKHPFSRFEEIAKPSVSSVNALGGVRKISPRSVGNWRQHLPRVKAQIEIHGPVTPALVQLEYEAGPEWEAILDGVVADNGNQHRFVRPGHRALLNNVMRRIKAALGSPSTKRVVVKENS